MENTTNNYPRVNVFLAVVCIIYICLAIAAFLLPQQWTSFLMDMSWLRSVAPATLGVATASLAMSITSYVFVSGNLRSIRAEKRGTHEETITYMMSRYAWEIRFIATLGFITVFVCVGALIAINKINTSNPPSSYPPVEIDGILAQLLCAAVLSVIMEVFFAVAFAMRIVALDHAVLRFARRLKKIYEWRVMRKDKDFCDDPSFSIWKSFFPIWRLRNYYKKNRKGKPCKKCKKAQNNLQYINADSFLNTFRTVEIIVQRLIKNYDTEIEEIMGKAAVTQFFLRENSDLNASFLTDFAYPYLKLLTYRNACVVCGADYILKYNDKKVNTIYTTLQKEYLTNSLLNGIVLNNVKFDYANFRDANLSSSSMTSAHLKNVILKSADMRDGDFSSTIFENTDLSGANATGAKVAGAIFRGEKTNLAGIELKNTSLKHVLFDEVTKMNGINFENSFMPNIEFESYKYRIELKESKFTGAQLYQSIFSNVDLLFADMSNTVLINAIFNNSNLTNANLSKADALHSSFHSTHLERTNLSECNLVESEFSCVTMTESYCSNASFRRTRMKDCTCSYTIMSNCDFTDSFVSEVSFQHALCQHSIFWRAQLKQVSFENANLSFSVCDGTTIDSCNFSFSDLRGVLFSNAKLINSLLLCVDLRDGNLTNTDFESCNLIDSSLENALLYQTNFQGSNLTGVCFKNAKQVNKAKFKDAILDKADFTGTGIHKDSISGYKSAKDVMWDA